MLVEVVKDYSQELKMKTRRQKPSTRNREKLTYAAKKKEANIPRQP
jgi:hypothetical protein